jgi:hypothetical protein
MRTAPTPTTEVLLGLNLQMKAEARAGIYRLYCSDQWKPKSESLGHAYMTQGIIKELILQMGTDKMIPRHVCDKPFTVRFPDRSEWKDGLQPDGKGRLIWHIDGSKANYGTGAGCMVMIQNGVVVSVLGNTQQYSRQKHMPSRHAQYRT